MLKFKQMFEKERKSLLYTHTLVNEDFHVHEEDLHDTTDLTSSELETSMRLRLRSRETLYLKKIEDALHRISIGTFGLCTECGNEIGLKRLEARPTADCCISCKEEQENRENHHIDGHKPKSVGMRTFLN